MNYETETRDAYRNKLKAKAYHEQYTKGAKWARFTMWRQKIIIEKIIKKCNFKQSDRILDIPCGTGFIGQILCKSPASVIASDISSEMMEQAYGEYGGDNFNGFVKCDITQTPFKKESFDCVMLLAFMHRLPKEIRGKTWEEVISLSKKYVIVNYSLDSHFQKLKQWLVKRVHPNHIPAPSSLPLQDIRNEIKSYGLIVTRVFHVAPLLSAKILFLLEKT